MICNITYRANTIRRREYHGIAYHSQNGKITTGSTGNYTGFRAGMFSCTGGMGLWKRVSMTTLGVFHIFPLCRKYPI